jgi:hypothetical protein
VHGQVRQEGFDLWCGGEEVFARPHAVETDEPDDPLHRGALGMNGGVVETEHRADFIADWVVDFSSCQAYKVFAMAP